MKGIILGFDESKEEGKIRGNDENRYRFVRSDFNADQLPESGGEVDFEIEDGMAKDIYVVQKVAPQDVNLQDIQAKAANIVGNISSNEDVIKVKGTMMAGFNSAPIAIVALLVYAVATFLPFASVHVGWFGLEISLFDTDIGKGVLVLLVLLLGMIISDIVKTKRTFKFLGALALLVLPFIAFAFELNSVAHSFGRVDASDLLDAFGKNGSFGVGYYLIMISALVLLFSPIKKQGATK